MGSLFARSALAEELIVQTCDKQGIALRQLSLRADRGGWWYPKAVAQLLASRQPGSYSSL